TLFSAAAFATAAAMARAVSLPWPTAGTRDPWRGVAVLGLASACVVAAWPFAAIPVLTTLPKILAPSLVLLAGAALLARFPIRGTAPAGDLLTLVPGMRAPAPERHHPPLAAAPETPDHQT
ncbi:MAG: hypothetical protein AAFT19_08295, partial [Pseudomonadota bacterium]